MCSVDTIHTLALLWAHLHETVMPSSHRTRSTSQQQVYADFGTHYHQWECSHKLQATSKGLHASVLARPEWTGPHTNPSRTTSLSKFHSPWSWMPGNEKFFHKTYLCFLRCFFLAENPTWRVGLRLRCSRVSAPCLVCRHVLITTSMNWSHVLFGSCVFQAHVSHWKLFRSRAKGRNTLGVVRLAYLIEPRLPLCTVHTWWFILVICKKLKPGQFF